MITVNVQSLHMERPSPSDLYSVKEVRTLFRISRRTVSNWQKKGILKPVRFGGQKLLFRRSDIESLIGNQK